jgi:hypothetical protein
MTAVCVHTHKHKHGEYYKKRKFVSMDFYPSLHVLLLGSADVFVRSQYPPSVCSVRFIFFSVTQLDGWCRL